MRSESDPWTDGKESPDEIETDLWAEVAVPLPFPHPLTYSVPTQWRPLIGPGHRVRVSVGPRRHTGFVVRLRSSPPEGVKTRDLEAVLDLEPVLDPDLLQLAAFVSDYYLAPIGDAVRAMVPGDLDAWADRRVGVTDAGAIASPSASVREQEVLSTLMARGPQSMAGLQGALGGGDLDGVVGGLERRGWLRRRRRGGSLQTRTAVDLVPLDPVLRLERCGRSPKARAVIRFLEAIERPASVDEVAEAAECGPGVVRRLLALGLLRSFTELRPLDLGRHFLGGETSPPHFELRPDQEAALGALRRGLEESSYRGFLLAGMTGSGKTEVYLRAASTVLSAGGGAIFLVPEIALVPALAQSLRSRFGSSLAVLHSGLSRSERRREWERIRTGEARLVLGPRSAVFAPVRGLRLLVVDEEQDSSYKQDSSPRYHGRDLALVRARALGAVAVLVSATPSLESRHNAESGKLRRLELTDRVGAGGLPEGVLVDLRLEEAPPRPGEVVFSAILLEEIESALAAGDQIVLLRNRRGYAPRLLCRACGEDHRCEDCGLPRTLHLRQKRLVCHYCGSKRRRPEVCVACGEEALEPIGAGTERVEERFRELYPEVGIAVLDRDTARRPGGLTGVLERFSSGRARVLIGTQMVAKGHHFPAVALAAVLSADSYLGFPDFRAVEKTYDLLVQLAGRAGRGERPGRVVIQTYHPDHYGIQAALTNDDEGFAQEEMRFRRVFGYPPFKKMIQLVVSDRHHQRAEDAIRELARELDRTRPQGVRVSGPAPAPLERLRGEWRHQILVRGGNGAVLRRWVQRAAEKTKGRSLTVDVDPIELF